MLEILVRKGKNTKNNNNNNNDNYKNHEINLQNKQISNYVEQDMVEL
jgi:hypothetical protein